MNLLKTNKHNIGLHLIIIVTITIILYYQFKSFFISTDFFEVIEFYYAKILVAILSFFSENYSVDISRRGILYNESLSQFSHVLVMKYYVLTAVILFLFPRSLKKTILIYLGASLLFFILTIFRLLLQRYFPDDSIGFLITLIISIRYFLLYKLFNYKLQQFESTKQFLSEWNVKISSTFYFSLNTLLTVIAFIPALTGLFDWFLVAKWNVFVVYLTKLILTFSNGFLWMLGYSEAYIWGKYILLKNYWLLLDSNCLGVGLMVVFTTMILAIRSPITNRLIYTLTGILFIIIMNAVRIVLILLYIYRNQIPSNKIEDYHDFSNNIFYIVIFFVILLYIFWFQHIQIKSKKE